MPTPGTVPSVSRTVAPPASPILPRPLLSLRLPFASSPVSPIWLVLLCAAFTAAVLACADPARGGECDDWPSRHPAWLWCDDFESGDSLRSRYQDVSTNDGRFGVSSEDAHSGTRSLRQHYDAGQVEGGWVWRMFGKNPHAGDAGERYRDIHVRWFHKFEPGFEGAPAKMARMRIFTPEHWRGAHTTHFWISSSDSHVLMEPVSYVAPGGTQVDPNAERWLGKVRTPFSYADAANKGRWVCHEMHVKLNEPGVANGFAEFFADGESIGKKTGMDMVGAYEAYGINGMMLDTYWNAGSPKAQSRYYDDFVVSTEPIGCATPVSAQPVDAMPAPALLVAALSLGGSGRRLLARGRRARRNATPLT